MRPRLVALLWVAAVGCYSDRPAQSTLPEPDTEFGPTGPGLSSGGPGAPAPMVAPTGPATAGLDPNYVAGPPGGDMDPGSAYSQDPAGSAGDSDEDGPGDAPVPAPDALGALPPAIPLGAPDLPADGEPDEAVAAGDPGQPGIAAGQPGDLTASVSDAEIDTALQGYGQWIETEDYGQVWRPDATVVGADFTPYESDGSWQDTDAGWAFSCDYSWGWLPFHYGRWARFHDYWGWVPGHRWGPAWVEWRHGGGVVGWRPSAPTIVRDHRHGAGYHFGGGSPTIRDHRHAEQHDGNWRFATHRDFGRPHIRSHLYANAGEALRVTSRVAAPPLRARTTVHAGDLMRGRFATSGRTFGQPARGMSSTPSSGGAPVVRDHRDFGRRDPAIGRYERPSGGDSPAARGYPPAGRGYPPPAARGDNPRGFNQPGQAGQAGQAGQPGQPGQPGRSDNPRGRIYNNPSAPPARAYNPPGRSYPPAGAPPRSYSPSAPPSTPWHGSGGPHVGGGASPSSGTHFGGSGPTSGGSHPSAGGSAPRSGTHASGGSSGGGSHSSSGNTSTSSSHSGRR